MPLRVIAMGLSPAWCETLRIELKMRSAELVVAKDGEELERQLEERVGGVISALDPLPTASGLAFLMAARTRAPGARRVLVVEPDATLADAALAAGIADRVLCAPLPASRASVIAEWLVAVCDDGPRTVERRAEHTWR